MSDDSAPDPIDQAYVRAEAALSDDEARAARRARVLAAVAREPMTPPAASSTPLWRPARRYGGWLAAAGVAGLSLFVATQFYPPSPRQPQAAPTRPSAPAEPPTPAPRAPPAAPRAAIPAPGPPPTFVPLVARPPPPLPIMPPFDPPSVSLAPGPAAAPPAAVVTAERKAAAPPADSAGRVSGGWRDESAEAQSLAPSAENRASISAFAAAPAAPPSRSDSSARRPSDEAARLRAAAAGGRAAEVEALLAEGVPIDSPDADGQTALMKAIQADHPAAAALLRRHGASLDRKNHAGESARDMATAKGDAELDQAIGLGP